LELKNVKKNVFMRLIALLKYVVMRLKSVRRGHR
jgi:hypothetical protein